MGPSLYFERIVLFNVLNGLVLRSKHLNSSPHMGPRMFFHRFPKGQPICLIYVPKFIIHLANFSLLIWTHSYHGCSLQKVINGLYQYWRWSGDGQQQPIPQRWWLMAKANPINGVSSPFSHLFVLAPCTEDAHTQLIHLSTPTGKTIYAAGE